MTFGLQVKEDRKGGGVNIANSTLSTFAKWQPNPSQRNGGSELVLNTDRVTLFLGLAPMRGGKVITSRELLSVYGCLKQNQLQSCHTPSASCEFCREL